jgi:trehalose 6-phosphate synthase/phosphatase
LSYKENLLENTPYTGESVERKIMVVSNREPYIHRRVGDGLRIERPTGGLTSAMDDALKTLGGLWIAWGSGSADRSPVDSRDSLEVPPENPAYRLKRVWLHPRLVENYYNGYSNQVLWPLCHITLDRVYYRKKFWEAYLKVNRIFTQAVLEETIQYPTVWIHDYHLCLLPGMLRKKAPHLTMAHFWHIPWPSWSVFRICPQACEILESLLANDLIGFQIPLFAKNFLSCVRECLDAEVSVDPPAVFYNGRRTLIKDFSIGIDYEKFNTMASSPRTGRLMKKIKKKYELPVYLGLGVDRLDYTKALLKRLQAIDLFFEKYGRFKSKVTFLQVAVPTRLQEPYISYKQSVEKLIAKINEKYARDGWRPIIYETAKIEQQDLVAYYRLADFAVISSVYDGMNLVAKEYAASQVDEKGVLILSELAGAADTLDGALIVNPYDMEEFAENIKKALTMSGREKEGRMRNLRSQIHRGNIHKWIRDIVQDLHTLAALKEKEEAYFFNHLPEIVTALQGRPVNLFFDYDGSLAPIAETPEQAKLPPENRALLMALRSSAKIGIISGRSLEDLKTMVGIPDIIYVGNHGAEICDGAAVRISHYSEADEAKLTEFLNRLRVQLADIPGVFIEEKGITASVHFRKVSEKALGNLFTLFWETARDYKDRFRIGTGKKVLEIKPLAAWNKGEALSLILKTLPPENCSVYLGDDTTDEDAYKVLAEKGFSVSIGKNPKADYYLKIQPEVTLLLEHLLTILKAP